MADFRLSGEEIINILKVCRETGVSAFDLGPLSVRFGLPVATDRGICVIPAENAPLLSPVATLAEPDHPKLSKEALEIEELLLREEQIAELTVTDPLAAEQMITNGELTVDEPGRDETALD